MIVGTKCIFVKEDFILVLVNMNLELLSPHGHTSHTNGRMSIFLKIYVVLMEIVA
jgi:hypothetical protein